METEPISADSAKTDNMRDTVDTANTMENKIKDAAGCIVRMMEENLEVYAPLRNTFREQAPFYRRVRVQSIGKYLHDDPNGGTSAMKKAYSIVQNWIQNETLAHATNTREMLYAKDLLELSEAWSSGVASDWK